MKKIDAKELEAMKNYIREHNLTAQVREFVEGADFEVAQAVELVYDTHTLSNEQFKSKYFVW